MTRTVKKIQLPKDFASNLLDLEIEYKLADRPSTNTIKNLIGMYTLGVEYYESIRSHKYMYFQLKMTQIFNNANTMNSIDQQSQATQEQESPLKKKMRSEKQQDKIQALQIKQKQQKMLQEMASNASEVATVTTMKKLLSQNELKNKVVNEKVHKQLTNQDIKLKEKLQKRRSRIMYSKSFSSVGFMGENDTKDTLFSDTNGVICLEQSTVKPIQVNFGSVIKQNESDEDTEHQGKVTSLQVVKIQESLKNENE